MSFTDTEKHWLWGCAVATAASRSDVNVAMPHLRGKWSPTHAILRILEPSSMRQSLHSSRPALLCRRVCAPTANVRPQRELGKDSGSVDSVLRAVVFKACGSTDPDAGWQEQEGYSRRYSDRLDEPSQAIPRHGCIPAEPAAVSPGKIIVPRIVIGGVILDQSAIWGCRPASISCGATNPMAPCSETLQ